MESASLATSLMKMSIKTLKETVGTGEYQWILTKTKELEKEISGVLESIKKRQQLEDKIKDFKQYLNSPDPKYITNHFKGVFISCLGCNTDAQEEDIELSLKKIVHAPKCKYILSDQPEPQKTMKWIRIIHDYDRKKIRKLKS